MTNQSHKGLVKKKVTVKKDGKTFERYQWVKATEDKPVEPKGKKEVPKPKGSFNIGDTVFYGGKNREIIKVSESQGTAKLDNGQVYTFAAINKIKGKPEVDKPKKLPIKVAKPNKVAKPTKVVKPIKVVKKKISTVGDAKKSMKSHVNELNKTDDGKDLLDRIESYTGGDYKSFNEYLRTGKIATRDFSGKVKFAKPTKAKKESRDAEINKISDFLKDAPKMEGSVYRGMMWKQDPKSTKEFNNFINNIENNSSITFPTFSSTSTDESTATEFATLASKKEPVHSVIIEMKSKNGVYLNGTSAFANENEVLFNKDSKFDIVSVDKTKDPNRIVLSEV